jgi:hypothetical protein|uniref:Uncharacterized protein n=1 Tax=viral metagenome TaxID=1070528 RepID=A0A6C0ISU9_9ZZZZ
METINSKKELQNYIYLLNESCNKSKLKLTSQNISSQDEFNLNDELNSFFDNLTNVSFTTSKDVLHPNLIAFLIKNDICSIKRINDAKNKIICFLENNITKKNIYISKQIWFGYLFFEKLKTYRKKKFMKDFFDEDGYIQNLKIEEWSRSWNGVKNTRRLDFELDIGNDRKIVIEYLEDHHTNELKDWNLYQSIRLVDILFGDKKDQIVHFAFVWDKLITDTYIKQKVKYIVNKIKDFHNIDNEKEYTISILNEEIKNKKLSEIFYESYLNENKPVIDLRIIFKFFKIKSDNKDIVRKRFFDTVTSLNIEDNYNENISDEDSLNEDDEYISNEDLTVYYENIDNIVNLSNSGLCLFLSICQLDDFDNITQFSDITTFINKIGKSAYKSACKIRNIIISQKENLISGLDDI